MVTFLRRPLVLTLDGAGVQPTHRLQYPESRLLTPTVAECSRRTPRVRGLEPRVSGAAARCSGRYLARYIGSQLPSRDRQLVNLVGAVGEPQRAQVGVRPGE